MKCYECGEEVDMSCPCGSKNIDEKVIGNVTYEHCRDCGALGASKRVPTEKIAKVFGLKRLKQ